MAGNVPTHREILSCLSGFVYQNRKGECSMRRALLVAAAVLAMANTTQVRADVITETIPLRYLNAQNVPKALKTTRGIEQLTLNFNDNSIPVRGNDDAVVALKTELRSLDVQTTQFRLNVKLTRRSKAKS
jgi:hypothetical protein